MNTVSKKQHGLFIKNLFIKTQEDRIFSFLLVICTGFLPVFIAYFGDKLFKIPVFFLSFLVVLRLIRHHDERPAFLATALSPPSFLLLFAALYVFIHGLADVYFLESSTSTLSKSFLVFSCWTLLAYAWSHGEKIDNTLFVRYLLAGHLIALVLLITTYLYMLYLSFHPAISPPAGKHVGGPLKDIFKGGMVYIQVTILTGGLVINSVLLFFYAAFFENKCRRYGFLLFFALFFFTMTFLVIGDYGHASHIRHIVSETSQFGLPLALAVVLITSFFPRLMTHLFFSSSLVVMAGAPWIYQYLYQLTFTFPVLKSLKNVILVRLEIWDAVSRRALLSPLWGHGINDLKSHDVLELSRTYVSSIHKIIHPHNMILQIWNDCGMIGIFIAISFLVYGWKFMNCVSFEKRPVILGGLTLLMVFILSTYSLWIPWVMTFITFSVLLAYLAGKES